MEWEKMTDFEVINLCLNGQTDIFSELTRRYKNLVYAIINRMINNPEEANDLAQDVFVKVYMNLSKYYPDYKFSTWIMRITTNHVIDYRRKKRHETVPISDAEHELPVIESPETAFFQKERKRQITQLVSDLPDMYKIPIMLYHQQGLSYQEISDVVQVPLSKVKNRIFRGRRMLKESMLREADLYGL